MSGHKQHAGSLALRTHMERAQVKQANRFARAELECMENYRRRGLRPLQFFEQPRRFGRAGLAIRQRKTHQNSVEILRAQELKPFARINGRDRGGAQYCADPLC